MVSGYHGHSDACRRIAVLAVILAGHCAAWPVCAQVIEEDPIDEDDLVRLVEEEDGRTYRRAISEGRGDSLLSDIRYLMGITIPDSLLHQDHSAQRAALRRPMVVAGRNERPNRVVMRSVMTWTSQQHEEEMFRSDRSLLRWDTRSARGEGSFGEIALSTHSEDRRSTSATLQYVGTGEAWELAVGAVSDQTSVNPIAGSRPVRLRSTDRSIRIESSGRPFSKPSFLKESFTVTGFGVRCGISEHGNVLAIVGRDDSDADAGVVGRIAAVFRLPGSAYVSSGVYTSSRERGPRQEVYGGVTNDVWSLSVGAVLDRSSTPSFISGIGIQPERAVRIFMTAWRKAVADPAPGTDQGISIHGRWRFAPNHTIQVHSSGAAYQPVSSGPMGRSLVRMAVMGRLGRGLEWTCSLRSHAEEEHRDGKVWSTRRKDLQLSLRRSLGPAMAVGITYRRSAVGPGGGVPASSSLDFRLRGSFDDFAYALWVGSFDAGSGLSLWASHPGLMLWPVSMVYSGNGVHCGVSSRVLLSGNAILAGYFSHVTNDRGSRLRSSIMCEIGL